MEFLRSVRTSKLLLAVNILLSLVYFVCIVWLFPIGNMPLFVLLVASEVFHVWQVIAFIHTVWPRTKKHAFDATFMPPAAVYITVCGEPAEIIEETVRAAKALRYPNFSIYILNDGKVANRDNWEEAEHIAARNGVRCITRTEPGGAKAGNINNALRLTNEPFVVVFDADHVPKPKFLLEMMGYFIDEKVAFVQSPQFYKNADYLRL